METEAHSGVVLSKQAHIDCGESACLKEEMAPEMVNTDRERPFPSALCSQHLPFYPGKPSIDSFNEISRLSHLEPDEEGTKGKWQVVGVPLGTI